MVVLYVMHAERYLMIMISKKDIWIVNNVMKITVKFVFRIEIEVIIIVEQSWEVMKDAPLWTNSNAIDAREEMHNIGYLHHHHHHHHNLHLNLKYQQ